MKIELTETEAKALIAFSEICKTDAVDWKFVLPVFDKIQRELAKNKND